LQFSGTFCIHDGVSTDHQLGGDNDKCYQAILHSLVALAKTLGTQLIAEGVETREESRGLLPLGLPM